MSRKPSLRQRNGESRGFPAMWKIVAEGRVARAVGTPALAAWTRRANRKRPRFAGTLPAKPHAPSLVMLRISLGGQRPRRNYEADYFSSVIIPGTLHC